jgi:hypothetical protein
MQSQVVDMNEARVMMDIPVCVWMTTCNCHVPAAAAALSSFDRLTPTLAREWNQSEIT